MREEKILKEAEKVFSLMHLEPAMVDTAIKAIKRSARMIKEFHEIEVCELKDKLNKITISMSKLRDLYLDDEIDNFTYNEKLQKLLTKEEKLIILIKAHYKTYNDSPDNIMLFTNLASNPHKTFKEASIEEKKKLIKLVFLNIKLNGNNLEYTLRSPFNMFIE